MPLQDLRIYQEYTARRRFPSRRLELLLAQVPMVLAQLQGHEARLDSFLFDEVPRRDDDDEAQEPDADAVASALNFAPRKRPPRNAQSGDNNDGKQPG